MPDVTPSYKTPFDFIAFFEYFHTILHILTLMSELLYLHQTFTDCISHRLAVRCDCKLWNAF